jgi:hypothetical protein
MFLNTMSAMFLNTMSAMFLNTLSAMFLNTELKVSWKQVQAAKVLRNHMFLYLQ